MVRLDLIGHGESEAPSDPARYRMNRAVADLTGILDRLQISRAHVLGYSMGGRLALSLAASAPARVKTLLLESSSPGLKTDAERRARQERDEALADRVEREGLEAFCPVLGKDSLVCNPSESTGEGTTGGSEKSGCPNGPTG